MGIYYKLYYLGQVLHT